MIINIKRRAQSGQEMVELPVALLLLLLIIFFPLLDLIGVGMAYACGMALNNTQLQQAITTSASSSSNWVTQCNNNLGSSSTLVSNFQNSGLGQFVLDPAAGNNVTTTFSTTKFSVTNLGTSGSDWTGNVTTTFIVKPFLSIPFPITVPGLNADVTLSITTSQVIEDTSSWTS